MRGGSGRFRLTSFTVTFVPANILLGLRGEVKLTDFGIAKASVRSIDTITGVVKGRFDYLSPEQARGGGCLPSCATFSAWASCCTKCLRVGIHFISRRNSKPSRPLRMHLFLPPVAFNPEVPPAIDRLLTQTLTASTNDRFASATAMKESLDRFFHEAGYIFSHATLATYLKGTSLS